MEQFHEYLSSYGKNRNKFVVHTDNNPLTYIFSSANLDAAGQQWVACLASYNFFLEYQKGKDNTVADFLSRMSECLPEEEVQEYLNKIPYPGVKAVLNNAITPIEERAEQGVRPTPDCQGDCQEETVEARPARLATTNVTDWKQEQKEDPVLYQVAKHLRVPWETFKAALHKVLDKKATAAYVKVKEQLLIKNGLLYHKTWQDQADEVVFQFVVPQMHWGTTLMVATERWLIRVNVTLPPLCRNASGGQAWLKTSETTLKSVVTVGNMRLLHQWHLWSL